MKRALLVCLSVVLLALASPVWVLGVALTPISYLRQWCYQVCAVIFRRFLGRNRPMDWREESKVQGFLRRARRDRRHARAVRP